MDPVFKIETPDSNSQTLVVDESISKIYLTRFFSYVEVDSASGCWVWVGGRNSDGYGAFYYKGRYRGAHRFIYEAFHGQLERKFEVHHKCGNKFCVNPLHLEALITRQHSRVTHGYANDYLDEGFCIYGHALTEGNVYNPPGTKKRRCRICLNNWEQSKRKQLNANRPAAEKVIGECERGHPGKLPGHPCKECHRIDSAAYYERIRDAANEEREKTGTIPVGSKFRTECKNKHSLLDPENLLYSRHGYRKCRQCSIDAMARRWSADKEGVKAAKRKGYAEKKEAMAAISDAAKAGPEKMLEVWLAKHSAILIMTSDEVNNISYSTYVINGWPIIVWRDSSRGSWDVFKPVRMDTLVDRNFTELLARTAKYVSGDPGPLISMAGVPNSSVDSITEQA